jgi:hypothetical protein
MTVAARHVQRRPRGPEAARPAEILQSTAGIGLFKSPPWWDFYIWEAVGSWLPALRVRFCARALRALASHGSGD